MKYLVKIIFFLFILLYASCATDDQCRKNRFVQFQVGIYHVTYDGTTKTRSAAYLPIDSLNVKGVGVDSILFNKYKYVGSSIALPLNKLATESKFELKFNNVTDTVTILHTNFNTYLSLECGCIKTHTIDSVYSTTHFLDSVKISVPDVNTSTSAQENIKLYN